MPFLDSARFIAESIDSVRAQSFSDWELLLCDDGATDGSTDIARRHASVDPSRIRHLEHPGRETRGASAARNLGGAHARGEYVAFLDADDVWLPNKLAEQVALLDARPDADALCGSTLLWYGWTGRLEDVRLDRTLTLGPPHGSLWPAPSFLTLRLQGRAASPATCSLIVRRAAFERSGGFEESFRTVYTDQTFYVKLFLRASLLVADTCWDRYRQHDTSAVNRETSGGTIESEKLRHLLWAQDYFAREGVRDRALRRALRYAIWGVRNPRWYALLRTVRRTIRRLRTLPRSVARPRAPRSA